MKLLGKIRDALRLGDPYSPASFGNPRYRLKTGDAYVETVRQGGEATLAIAPERYVEFGAEEPPAGRVRQLTPYLEERWEAIPAPIAAESYNAVLAAAATGVPVAGYRVTQRARAAHCDCETRSFARSPRGFVHAECGRPMESRVVGEIREHVLGLAIQANDTTDGYYATIKGTDAFDDRVTTGGTRITGGRAEYKRVLKTRGYEQWDTGWQRDTDRIRVEQQARRDASFELDQERAHKSLPRKIGEV